MRFVAGLMFRLGAAILIIGGIFYLAVIAPRQALNNTVKNHINDAQNFNSSLETASDRLKNLPNPNTIIPSQKSARAYANKINEAKGAFSTVKPEIPAPINNQSRNERITRFNAAISESDYQKAIRQGGSILSADQAFLAHHAAIMLALANLLEYNPAKDLSGSKEALAQNLTAAQGGLQLTIDRIKAAPKYDNDKTLSEITNLVAEVQAARDKLAGAVGKAAFSAEKAAYIATVGQAQKAIITNRSAFWSSESSRLLKSTNQAQIAFAPYLTRLQSN